MRRHAARQIAGVLLSFAGGARLWVFGLFLPLSLRMNGELKAAATHAYISSRDQMDAKRRLLSIESAGFEVTELIEIYMFNNIA